MMKNNSTEEISHNKNSETNKIEKGKHLNVYLRIKAGAENFQDSYEIQNIKIFVSKSIDTFHSTKCNNDGNFIRKKYEFSKIFGEDTKQNDIFEEIMIPKLKKFIDGFNCTLMTYGVTGSGKTYTIMGTKQDPGVLPRSLEYLFKSLNVKSKPEFKPCSQGGTVRLRSKDILRELRLKQDILNLNLLDADSAEYFKLQEDMRYTTNEKVSSEKDSSCHSYVVWISFAEIYNENVFDLLQHNIFSGKPKEKLKIGSSDSCIHIKNLTCISVSSALEAFQIFQYGLKNLNYAKTRIHDHSSRSHSIFTIKLIQFGNDTTRVHVSSLNFCDLAGSERSKKTMNVGKRLKESNNINTSLLVLGRCISGVRNAQKISDFRQIPFRDSKLTLLFQNALLGQEDISMIVNVNPSKYFFDETQHVLNFSAIAKEIEVVEQPKIDLEVQPKIDLEILSDDEKGENEENSNESKSETVMKSSSHSIETVRQSPTFHNLNHDVTRKYFQWSLNDVTDMTSVDKCVSEDCMKYLRGKVFDQKYIIAEHHKTISTLRTEIFKSRIGYQEKLEKLEIEIQEQRELIAVLRKQLDELEERNKYRSI